MRMVIGWIAAVLTAVASPVVGQTPAAPRPVPRANAKPKAPAGPMVTYEIRSISMGSPEWRGKFDGRLKPIAHQAGSSVWMVDDDTLREMLTELQRDPRSSIIQAPKVVTPVDQTAKVTNEEAVNYVAHVKKVVDKTEPSSQKTAFQPELDKIQNGIRLMLSGGRLVPQKGVRVRVSLEDTHLVGFHTTTVSSEPDSNTGGPHAQSESRLGKLLHGVARDSGAHDVSATIQIPEVAWSMIEGEWLVPENGALILSAGPRSLLGKRGKEGYSERIVAISVRVRSETSPDPSEAPRTASRLP